MRELHILLGGNLVYSKLEIEQTLLSGVRIGTGMILCTGCVVIWVIWKTAL